MTLKFIWLFVRPEALSGKCGLLLGLRHAALFNYTLTGSRAFSGGFVVKILKNDYLVDPYEGRKSIYHKEIA